MVTTVQQRPRALRHLSSWLQAIGLVYATAFGLVLLGAVVSWGLRGAIEGLSWLAGLMR